VAFIKHGEVLETRELRGAAEEVLRISMRVRKLTEETINGLSPWASSLRLDGERLSFSVSSADVLPEILRFLVGRGVDVFEVTPQRTSLEEMFLEIVGTDGGL
jgi:ABC-2 type transport system ATP-binding protein